MSKDPMTGLKNDPPASPIDRENAQDLAPTKPRKGQQGLDPKVAQAAKPPAAEPQQALTMEEALRRAQEEAATAVGTMPQPRRFVFVPTGATKIIEMAEAINMGVLAIMGVHPPEKGTMALMSLAEPYYNSLSDATQAFFHELQAADPDTKK